MDLGLPALLRRKLGKRRSFKRKVFAWLMVIFPLIGFGDIKEDDIDCRVTSPALVGQPSTVDCLFRDNFEANESFSLEFLADGPKPQPVEVVDCYFVNASIPNCGRTVKGFQFSPHDASTRRWAVRIPRTRADHGGRFTCKKTTLRQQIHKTCWLRPIIPPKRTRHRPLKTKTACTTSVVKGRDSFVACQFQKSPQLEKRAFHVIRYDLDGMPMPDLVLQCYWPFPSTDPFCHTKAGYTFDGKISSVVTIGIFNASQNHAGTYVCMEAPFRPETSACIMRIKDSEEWENDRTSRPALSLAYDQKESTTSNGAAINRPQKPNRYRNTLIVIFELVIQFQQFLFLRVHSLLRLCL